MKEFKKQAQEFAHKAYKLFQKRFNGEDFEIDHIAYQTVSVGEYSKWKRSCGKLGKVIAEFSHSGRRITTYFFEAGIEVDGHKVVKVELREPKPGKEYKKNEFDHLAFYMPNYEEFVKGQREKGVKFKKELQIQDTKVLQYEEDGVELEFRNDRQGDTQKKTEEKLRKTETVTPARRSLGEGGEIAEKEKEKERGMEEEKQITMLKEQLEEERKARIRALADYQNLQKRVEKEREQLQFMANAALLANVFDVMDDFDRIFSSDERGDVFVEGIQHVYDKLKKLIDDMGIKEIKCKEGDTFDPELHEAVGTVTVEDEKEDNRIKHIAAKGYRIDGGEEVGERVLRHVKVIVGKRG